MQLYCSILRSDHHLNSNFYSLFNSGIYLGGALASLSGLLIANAGWAWAYMIVGAIGGGLGVVFLMFVREPERGSESQREPD